MGVVYEAVPQAGGEPVAIKVFYPDTQLPPAELAHLRERFEREGKQLSTLHHRNVVQVYEFGDQGGLEFIVMEKLEASTSRSYSSWARASRSPRHSTSCCSSWPACPRATAPAWYTAMSSPP